MGIVCKKGPHVVTVSCLIYNFVVTFVIFYTLVYFELINYIVNDHTHCSRIVRLYMYN